MSKFECPECMGDGRLWAPSGYYYGDDCPRCEGEGTVEEEDEDEE